MYIVIVELVAHFDATEDGISRENFFHFKGDSEDGKKWLMEMSMQPGYKRFASAVTLIPISEINTRRR